MITSIVLRNEFSIGVDNHETFRWDGKKIGLKEVPFVRYRFEAYNQSSVDYINRMKKLFKYSSHMAEITVKYEGARQEFELLKNGVENLITYLYVPITDMDIANGINNGLITALSEYKGLDFDRVMIKDMSSSLHSVSANEIKKIIGNILEVSPYEIGACNSPLSFIEGEACLTAAMARQLAAMYAESDEGALPTANHECMNTCGCIRYIEITSNISVPVMNVKASNNGGTKKTTSKTKVSIKGIPKYGAW